METRSAKVADTKAQILRAAHDVLLAQGNAGLSTRRVAEQAEVPLSQIQYHFGSKEGMILALFENMNRALLDRQRAMFDDPALTVAQQWDRACDFLEDDLNSGYVQILQELVGAGWSNPTIRAAVAGGLDHWHRLLVAAVTRAARRTGVLSPFTADEAAALVSVVFLGVEAQIMLGRDRPDVPMRAALRRVGDVIRSLEAVKQKEDG